MWAKIARIQRQAAWATTEDPVMIKDPADLEDIIPLSPQPKAFAARLIVVGLLRGWDRDLLERIAENYDVDIPTRDGAITWAIKRWVKK